MLTESEGHVLAQLARQTIRKHLGLECTENIPRHVLEADVFQQKRGVFVTLNKRGILRGCIGSLVGEQTIAEGICHHAINAAFHDHRFPRLSADELALLTINISILTEPQVLDYHDGEELLKKLRPNIDGVILSGIGGRGATFLPQVWKQLPLPEDFLCHLCRKAGLADTYWREGNPEIQTYQAQYFEENN
jgi:AmmeMemoRadiSam system protein A